MYKPTKTSSLQRVQSSRPWEPLPYQLKCAKFLVERAEAGLFLDPGLRKTSCTLAAIKVLLKKKMARRVLVLAPLRVAHSVWPAEIKKWKDFEHLRVVVLHGPDKDKLVQQDADVYVMNYEGIDWLLGAHKAVAPNGKVSTKYDLKNFKTLNADILVCDESSKLKKTDTVRFKALRPILGKFNRRWILTGTPAPNGLLDLFGQAYVMDQGKSLGQFITHYKSRYFMPADRMGYKWVPMPGSEEKIYAALGTYVLRLDAKDYLELPEMVENDIIVELPPKARKFYDDLETEFLATLDSGETITAPSTGAAIIKLRQTANGACYNTPVVDDSGIPTNTREWSVLHNAKLEALVDLVDELQGSPLLVAYGFKHDLYRIREVLGKDVPHLGSGVSGKETNEILQRWNAGEIPVLLGHPASMGHGLNMQDAGNHVAWFAPNYDLELYDQFNKRVLRSGNTNSHVYVHRFIAKGTVDELIVAALRRKAKGQGALLDALKEYRQSR